MRGDHRIGLESGQFNTEYVDPRAKLSAEDLKKLSGFVKTEKDGQKVIPVGVAASVNGKTLELLSNPELTATAFWTMDMETGNDFPRSSDKLLCQGRNDRSGRGICCV